MPSFLSRLQHLHAAAVMADITLPLQAYCASLDESSLPKIVQVCSGVYFQGSVYEMSGSEVCFSTGDLIKVIAIELQSVSCEDVSNNDKFELPIHHTGLFKVVPEQLPYSTVEEILKLRPLDLESSLPFTFTSRTKITIDNFTLSPGKELTVRCIKRLEDGKEYVRCFIPGQQDTSAEVCIPLSTKGEFYECESEECFTLTEIMTSSCLRSRRFRFANTTKLQQPLLFSPVYQVHAIMNLRQNVLKFPSTLEVDVVDITDICTADFVTPFSLTEILSQPDENFPAVLEIIEGPGSCAMFKCNWLSGLKQHNKVIFHKKGSTALVLLSNIKSRKTQQYFLVSQQYGGRFKRRPREFSSVYELYAASVNASGLKVSVTRNCEEVEEEGVPTLSVGEQLEIVRCERMELPKAKDDKEKQTIEALLCYRQADEDDDEEEEGVKREEMYLPMYMQGHFVEVLADNKKYKLKDLGKEFSLPLDVKVVTKDSTLENDPLATANLRIEAAMVEPVIQASFPSSPDQCFDIPSKWLSMTVYFTKECLPWPRDQPPKCHVETVTEVTNIFLYEFRKQATADVAPPPRPPKRDMSSSKSIKKSKKKSKSKAERTVPFKEFNDLTLNCKRRPPAPPTPEAIEVEGPPVVPRKPSTTVTTAGKAQPNTYVQVRDSIKKVPLNTAADMDSDHDYEPVEVFVEVVKKAQENVSFY
ncbi:protein THEMIS2 [Eucyclogobius newberryi]|uniref:protein THEMIS2 n=1 Tax=Eucyclogobius newberryi TaxID=166745 RepID=UPI003B58BD6A